MSKFTEEQKQFIIDNYETMKNSEIAEILSLTTAQVRGIGNKLGLCKKKVFTEEDIQFIENNYSTMDNIKIAETLNKTIKQIQSFAIRNNLKKEKNYYGLDSNKVTYLKIDNKETQIFDLTNMKFGKLTVISFNYDKYYYDLNRKEKRETDRMYYYWICNCECGSKNIIVENYNILSSKIQSCGCLSNENRLKNRINLDGQKYGRLRIVKEDFEREKLEKEKAENKSYHRYFLCNCDCGKENISVEMGALRSGRQVSCGCYLVECRSNRAHDLTGKTFGKLAVIERDYEEEEKRKNTRQCVYWKCICECGNTTTVSANDLRKGTKSCGCLQKENTSKANKRNGILKNGSLGDWMIKNLSENFIDLYWSDKNELSPFEMPYAGRNKIYIICDECGEEYSIDTYNFTLDNQRCANCGVMSKGEEKIKIFLDNHNIKYQQYKKYDELRGVKNGLLSYDFYVKNILIEYQGNFHDGSQGTDKFGNLETQQEHDRRKRQYAKDNNIKLLEIWYWDFDNVEEILKKELKIN